ncbi:MAG: HAD family hydrolase [Spirochaetaceae bacterium]|jgi:phosphoglycolate phosphatase|nr:HAD family hydrolase [Spirochaetaceae bacterium]
MKFKCVIFDLDGTLVNTLADIALSMNAALVWYGYPARAEADYAAIVGRGIRRLAEDALPSGARDSGAAEAVAEAVAEKAREYYAERPIVHAKPYPDIVELLYGLRSLKIKTAVLSNKPDPVAQAVISSLFPPALFDLVQGEQAGVPRKPDPAPVWDILIQLGVTPRETLFAGDSEIDMETARAAECSPLGVSWGFRERETLLASGAARIINRPLELLSLIQDTRY